MSEGWVILATLVITKIFDWLWEARKHKWEIESRSKSADDRQTIMNKIDKNAETAVEAIKEQRKSPSTLALQGKLDELLDRYRKDTCPECKNQEKEKETK